MFEHGFFGPRFLELFNGFKAEPVVRQKIRVYYTSEGAIGTSTFELPYEYTSETNIRAALSILHDLKEDILMVVQEHHNRSPKINLDSVRFEVAEVRV